MATGATVPRNRATADVVQELFFGQLIAVTGFTGVELDFVTLDQVLVGLGVEALSHHMIDLFFRQDLRQV